MQTTAHIIVDNKKIKVLLRPNLKRMHVALKKRKSGADGTFLKDESQYLSENPEALARLDADEVVYL